MRQAPKIVAFSLQKHINCGGRDDVKIRPLAGQPPHGRSVAWALADRVLWLSPPVTIYFCVVVIYCYFCMRAGAYSPATGGDFSWNA